MKKAPFVVTVLVIVTLISGCATSPENIPPAYVSHMAYMQYTVEQLGQEEARLQAALSTSSDAQRKARSNDTLGVIFLGLPVSSLSGSNQASNVARIKGELEAVQKALTLKGGKGAETTPAAQPAATPAAQPAGSK
jgi:hypothetical protein